MAVSPDMETEVPKKSMAVVMKAVRFVSSVTANALSTENDILRTKILTITDTAQKPLMLRTRQLQENPTKRCLRMYDVFLVRNSLNLKMI